MSQHLRFRLFAHSWISDWNHGNAHFLRGLASEIARLGHDVRCYEEVNSWSVKNLLQEGDAGARALSGFRQAFPELQTRFYQAGQNFPRFAENELRGADVVIIHEWNDPAVVKSILDLKPKLGFVALFHDTHHRAYTSPRQILRMPLQEFDGVLAFGEGIRRIYSEAFGVKRTWTFHEAADTVRFHPATAQKHTDVVWVGNWGDEERTRELEEFLVGPAAALRNRKFAVYGVRYPRAALHQLREAGIDFRGYLPNLDAPGTYANSCISLHVPRRFYANGLSGIPTIRMFEAMACGSPLLCSPWVDTEHLFSPGQDYICASSSTEMQAQIEFLLRDDAAREQLTRNGLKTIHSRHTCAHRAKELLDLCQELAR